MDHEKDTIHTAPRPPIKAASRSASIDSVSSAADRRRWRNHAHVLTPEPQAVDRDPFDDLADVLSPAPRRPSLDEKTTDGSKSGDVADPEDEDPGAGPVPCGNGLEDADTRRRFDDVPDTASQRRRAKLPWRERIRHFTWTWFCLTMATGGIANVLYAVPFRFRGLYALGCLFFIGNMVLFVFNVAMISCRFYLYPRTFRASFLHPTESLFIPAAIVSFGIIMMNISQYGVGMVGEKHWLQHVMIVLFWVDCGLAFTFSLGIYLIMFVNTTRPRNSPTDILLGGARPRSLSIR